MRRERDAVYIKNAMLRKVRKHGVFYTYRVISKKQYDILKEKSEKQPLTEELIRVVSAMTGRLAMIPAAQEGGSVK